jgi:hypothetical protein
LLGDPWITVNPGSDPVGKEEEEVSAGQKGSSILIGKLIADNKVMGFDIFTSGGGRVRGGKGGGGL